MGFFKGLKKSIFAPTKALGQLVTGKPGDALKTLENTVQSDYERVFGSGKGAKGAAALQAQAAQMGIDEIRALLSPFIGAGTQALGSQQALLGLSGQDAQNSAIQALQSSPFFQAQLQRGENSILQNASATGGLRGGNTQGALAQFSPQLLQQTYQQQLQNLGGLAGNGQQAASSAAFGISDLLQQQGAAQAGGLLAKDAQRNQLLGSALQIGGGLVGGFFGGPAGAAAGSSLGGAIGGGGGGSSFLSGGGLGSGGSGIGGGFITNPTANIQGLF